MCDIYRAKKEGCQEDVAIKVLRHEFEKNDHIRELFITEADISLLLHHPHLVSCIETGEDHGKTYIVTELFDGGTLFFLNYQLYQNNLRLNDDLSLLIISHILSGLDALHNARSTSGKWLGIIHRDVTPKNIFLSLDGRIVLGDYGVAHIEAYGTDIDKNVPGKLPYLAPECIRRGSADIRSDIYSVGVILHELLVGVKPFPERDPARLTRSIIKGRRPAIRKLRPNLSPHLCKTIDACLSINPSYRPQSAAEFRSLIGEFISPPLANPTLLGSLLRSLQSP